MFQHHMHKRERNTRSKLSQLKQCDMNWEQKSLIPIARPHSLGLCQGRQKLAKPLSFCQNCFFQNYLRDPTYGSTILAALEEYFIKQILSQRLLFHLHTHLLFYLSFGGHKRSMYNISNNILVLFQVVL